MQPHTAPTTTICASEREDDDVPTRQKTKICDCVVAFHSKRYTWRSRASNRYTRGHFHALLNAHPRNTNFALQFWHTTSTDGLKTIVKNENDTTPFRCATRPSRSAVLQAIFRRFSTQSSSFYLLQKITRYTGIRLLGLSFICLRLPLCLFLATVVPLWGHLREATKA